jgi:hypothetical protein
MHDVVKDQLEDHLNGMASRAFYAHLDRCADCSATVAEMESVSLLIRELRPRQGTFIGPSSGFYSEVADTIIEKRRNKAWGLFSPGRAFFRRVAFASLLLLAGLGSYLVSRDSGPLPSAGADAAAIMAQHDPSAADTPGSDRDRMLVTLATWSDQ